MKRLLVWAVLCASTHAQPLQLADRTVLEERFGRISGENQERAAILQALFAEAGCTGERFEERTVRGSRFRNLVCTLKGSSEETIYVTAHYDKVSLGEGAIDNWTGAALLPTLFQTLAANPRRLNFVFAAFCDEERGLVGSRDFVKQLSREQLANSVAEINIDSIGMTPTKVWLRRSDKTLASLVTAIARGMNVTVEGVNVDQVGDSDSRPFLEKKIPVIDFHSITNRTFPILHTIRDRRERVVWEDYYNTYRLISGMLAYLDAHPEAQPARRK